mgnify:CR=1 FL=1
MLYLNLFKNPVITALIAGYLSGNIYTGITTAGFVLLYQGINLRGAASSFFITLIINLTSNINFEIIFIFVISLFCFLNFKNEKRTLFINSIIIIISIPIWKLLLGFIPAEILNDFNVAGEVLLLGGIVYLVLEGEKAVFRGVSKKTYLIFIRFLLAITCIFGFELFLIFGPVLILLYYYLDNHFAFVSLNNTKEKIYSMVFFLTGILAFSLLLPLNFVLFFIGILLYLLLFYIEEISYLKFAYLCLLIGLNFSQFSILL